jgi:1-acyl-sn-glycerol-3-phosphate acyltransferase
MPREQVPIDQKTFSYSWLKNYVIFFLRRFYKSSIRGKEKIITHQPLIVVANHQNALMDALVILSLKDYQPVFMARSDIFANRKVARLLRFFKMLPIYRIRDGYDQLSNNRQVFSQAFGVLNNNNPLAIFPEGNHDVRFRLRSMKKGVAHISFSFRHDDTVKREIKILPIGLNYSDLHQPGSKLFINVGNMISLSDFDHDYEENPAKASHALLRKISDELKQLILHIDDEAHYNTSYVTVQLYGFFTHDQGKNHEDIFTDQKEIIEQIRHLQQHDAGGFAELQQAIASTEELLKKQDLALSDVVLVKYNNFLRKSILVGLIFYSPLYLLSVLQNLIPTLVLNKLRGKIKDPQFSSSTLLVGSIFIYPIFYLLQTLLFSFFSPEYRWTLLYLLSLPVSYWVMKNWQALYRTYRGAERMAGIKYGLLEQLAKVQQLLNKKFM